MDTILLLTPINNIRPSKKFHKTDKGIVATPYPSIYKSYFNEYAFGDIAGLVELLEAEQLKASSFAIRGEMIPGVDAVQPQRRLKHSDEERGVLATVQEVPGGHHWLMIDIDNQVNDYGAPESREEMEALIQGLVIKMLPPCFHEALYWYQWSNSMLITAGWETLKVHLWFFLKEAKTDTYLTQWAKTLDIDESVYRTVQPNYLALPKILGFDDPLQDWRSGLAYQYADFTEVDLDYQYQEEVIFRQKSAELVLLQQALWRQESKKFVEMDYHKASPPMQRIAEIGVNNRLHTPIIASAASWITCCGSNPDKAKWKELVRVQIDISAHKDKAHRRSDKYLNDVWNTAVRKYGPLNYNAPSVPRELLSNNNIF